MNIRRLVASDLASLLGLYSYLHPDDPSLDDKNELVLEHWVAITSDPRLVYFGAEMESKLVSSCTLTIIPNLTRAMRPYGVIENVVTHPEYRKRGLATAVLREALSQAWRSGCYKVMLETGSTEEATLRFYEKAGFVRGVKTGFIAYPE